MGSIEFWAAVSAIATAFLALFTLAAVLAALFGEAFKGRMFPPKAKIDIPEEKGDPISFSGHEAIYFHAKVVNERRFAGMRNVQVMLVAVSRERPNGEFIRENLSVPQPFDWAPASGSSPLQSFARDRFFDFGRLVKRAEQMEFHPTVRGYQKKEEWSIKGKSAIRYHLEIWTWEKVLKEETIEVSWDGEWPSTPEKAKKHIVIEKCSI